MIKALLDTNIILDIALNRPRFYSDAANIIKHVHRHGDEEWAATVKDFLKVILSHSTEFINRF
jgi:hypothetical protein